MVPYLVHKSYTSAMHLNKTGDDYFKSKKYLSALKCYTEGLMHCPALYEKKVADEFVEEYPLCLLFSNRSSVLFRLKRYDECITDVKRAVANGKHSNSRIIELMSRLAWSHWHLKQFKECSMVVNLTKTESCEITCKELDVLEALLAKSNANAGDATHDKLDLNEQVKNGSTPHLLDAESSDLKGVSSHVKLNRDSIRGRYLSAKSAMKPGSNLINEELYSGILNEKFSCSHCNYCFKNCRLTGVPCYGCSNALYCDEKCKKMSWQSYHWLECSMWPVLQTVDFYAQLALRTLLCAGHRLSIDGESAEELKKHCTLISDHLQTSFPIPRNKNFNNKKKHFKKPNSSAANGHPPFSNKYLGNYWDVFSLQTHESEHSKMVHTKCALYASFLGKVLNRCLHFRRSNKPTKLSNSKSRNENEVLFDNVESAFIKMSLKNLFQNAEMCKAFPDIELFREKTFETCKTMSSLVPVAKLKNQSASLSKDLPQNFQDIVTYLLKRHMLQLYTNCQAIYDVIPVDQEDNKNEVTTVSQHRIASAIFPSTSLMNHSCNPNTVVSFTGRFILVRAVYSILEGYEVSHCYGPCISRHSYQDRQKMLKDQYFFACKCSACVEFKEGDSDRRAFMQQFTAYKCQTCGDPIFIVESKVAADGVIRGKCANKACKVVYDLTNSCQTYNNLVSLSNSAAEMAQKDGPDEPLEILEKCLKEMEKILYHNHNSIASLHDQIAYYYSKKKDYKAAVSHVTSSLKIVAMRFGSNSIEAARETFKLTSLCFNAQQFSKAEKFLNKCLPVLKRLLSPTNDEVIQAERMSLMMKTLQLSSLKA